MLPILRGKFTPCLGNHHGFKPDLIEKVNIPDQSWEKKANTLFCNI